MRQRKSRQINCRDKWSSKTMIVLGSTGSGQPNLNPTSVFFLPAQKGGRAWSGETLGVRLHHPKQSGACTCGPGSDRLPWRETSRADTVIGRNRTLYLVLEHDVHPEVHPISFHDLAPRRLGRFMEHMSHPRLVSGVRSKIILGDDQISFLHADDVSEGKQYSHSINTFRSAQANTLNAFRDFPITKQIHIDF